MSKKKSDGSKTNLIGERFGRLVVENRAEERIKGFLTYECLCDCGKRISVTSVKLRAGKAKSCGNCYLSRLYRGEDSNYDGYVVLMRSDCDEGKIYLGKRENFDVEKHYNNSDNSLIYISDNQKMFHFLCSVGWMFSQQEMLDKGIFTEEDYAEFARLKETVLAELSVKTEIKFSINLNKHGSGVSFAYPDWNKQ